MWAGFLYKAFILYVYLITVDIFLRSKFQLKSEIADQHLSTCSSWLDSFSLNPFQLTFHDLKFSRNR